MLYYNRIDFSEGINVNEISASKKCISCHFSYLFLKRFKFQLPVCNVCQVVLMMPITINNAVVLNICVVVYVCIIVGISKSEAINLLKNVDLSKKSESM